MPSTPLSPPLIWRSHQEGIARINHLARTKEPFLFLFSYDKSHIFAEPLSALPQGVYYTLKQQSNAPQPPQYLKPFHFEKSPLSFFAYKEAFETLLEEIRSGNSYLLNLTFETPIQSNLTLEEIFHRANAPFKLYIEGHFVCFSPECFIEIEENTISTFPMKGTIDASIKNAEEEILNNPKEMAEHIMIVDLMRNDLAQIASNVRVEKFRYIEEIQAGQKRLLQVSSKIEATLPQQWQENLGELLNTLLPAGSITGTPKRKTMEILHHIEPTPRAFYTGVFGLYDGKSLQSAVMIRFIEQREGRYYYKSGGGITLDSDVEAEYQELCDKVYLPF